MQKGDKVNFNFIDPETKEQYIAENVEVTGFEQGADSWRMDVQYTTTKTNAVFFQLARYVATAKPGAAGIEDARRILRTVYDKLDAITIEALEDGTLNCNYRPKQGMHPAPIEEEMRQILEMPIFKAAVRYIFGLSQKPDQVEVKKGGGGVRVSGHWTKARFEKKKKETAEEIQLEFALLKLLRDYSTHRDKENPLYLLGNGGEFYHTVKADLDGVLTDEQERGAVLEIPPAELYKAYTGKQSAAISKGERERVDRLLTALQKDITTVYRKEHLPGGRVKWYEISLPKIILSKSAELTEGEAIARENGGGLPEAKTMLRIYFHPAFTLEINKRYGLFPDNYLERMDKAIGGGRKSNVSWLLVDYLNGIRGHGKQSGFETTVDFETLVEKLDLGGFKTKQGIPATAAKIEAAAKVAQKVGLALSWTKAPGRRGQHQYQFKLNPEFGKD